MLQEFLQPRRLEQVQARLRSLAAALAALMALLLLRLAWMQILQGQEYQRLAENNSTRTIPWRAPRGLILDRHLRVLVDNAPAHSVGLIPEELKRYSVQARAEILARLAGFMGLEEEELKAKLARQQQRPFAPLRLATDVDRKLLVKLEENRKQLPGLQVLEDSKRAYPERVAVHALGYVSEISERQLQDKAAEGYLPGDLIGQTGLEAVYDVILKGQDGGKHVRINARGRELKVLGETRPKSGNNLVLTLDLNLQRAAEQALGQNAGAIVALDPRNGDVLAMVSRPDFDPALFTGRLSSQKWSRLVQDERTPLNNRAIQGLYPPGSIFKLIVAVAGLESGAITPHWQAECLGIHWISTWPYRCWKEIGHGFISLEQAIVESCDIYFYQVGLRTKVEALYQWALEFGLGQDTGLDLDGERKGLVPNAAWKELTQHMPWFPGNTVMMSIGQGYLLATPLQLACAAAAIANGGIFWQPRLLRAVSLPDGKLLEQKLPLKRRQLPISTETLRWLRRAMIGAVERPRGTAWRARLQGISVAGKTGTAQNPHGEDHAAFICFAPVDNPQLALAVLVENGGEGGLAAAPMARAVMETYFSR